MAAVKGTQNCTKKPQWQGSNWDQRNNNQNASNNSLSPKGKVVIEIMMQPETTKIRLGEVIITKSNAITARVGGTCDKSALAPEMQDL